MRKRQHESDDTFEDVDELSVDEDGIVVLDETRVKKRRNQNGKTSVRIKK